MLKLVPSLSHAKNEEGLEYVRAAIVRQLDIRGKSVPATVTTLPFTPHRYFKN